MIDILLRFTFGLSEDIDALITTFKTSTQVETKLVIAQHVLVDFDSLVELLGEFQKHIKKEELTKLKQENQEIINFAFKCYHRTVGPYRKLLKDIRNNLGAHWTDMPWVKATQSGVISRVEWSKWEQFLISLKNQCDLTK